MPDIRTEFLFAITLEVDVLSLGDTPYGKLPTVLSRDEVMRFLKAVTDLTMRTILITIYAAGLRVSEVIALTAADIDS